MKIRLYNTYRHSVLGPVVPEEEYNCHPVTGVKGTWYKVREAMAINQYHYVENKELCR